MVESPEAVAIREKKRQEAQKTMMIAGGVFAVVAGAFAVAHLARDAKQAFSSAGRPRQAWEVE